jgi:hypothetical protein
LARRQLRDEANEVQPVWVLRRRVEVAIRPDGIPG